jgi:hypothetical protein
LSALFDNFGRNGGYEAILQRISSGEAEYRAKVEAKAAAAAAGGGGESKGVDGGGGDEEDEDKDNRISLVEMGGLIGILRAGSDLYMKVNNLLKIY